MDALRSVWLTLILALLTSAGAGFCQEPAEDSAVEATEPAEPAADGDVDPEAEADLVRATLQRAATAPRAASFRPLPQLEEPAQTFLDAYFPYTEIVENRARRLLSRSIEKSEAFLDRLVTSDKEETYRLVNPKTRSARETSEAVKARKAWLTAYKKYQAAGRSALSSEEIDPACTLVVVVKSEYLAYLVDTERELALYHFPIAYGVNPYGNKKLRFGDCRTPSSEIATISHVTPITHYAPNGVLDMNGMWMGLIVPNPERPGKFWSRGAGVGFHGTPFRTSLGMKASHGCVRMFEEDSRLLARYVRPGTRVIIWP